jgi:hypothetical protein
MARTAAAQSAPKQTRAELERLIGDLARRDRELLAEQLKLEDAKIEPVAEASLDAQVGAAVMRLIDGDAVTRPAGEPARRLHEILVLRRAIPRALEIANLRLLRAKYEAQEEISRDLEATWNSNLQKLVHLIFQIKDLGDAQARLQSEWTLRCGLPVQPMLCRAIAELTAPRGPLASVIADGNRIGVIREVWK